MRRKKHKWVLTMIFKVTQKQAEVAYNMDGPNLEVDRLPVESSFIYCTRCEKPYVTDKETWCQGTPGLPV